MMSISGRRKHIVQKYGDYDQFESKSHFDDNYLTLNQACKSHHVYVSPTQDSDYRFSDGGLHFYDIEGTVVFFSCE